MQKLLTLRNYIRLYANCINIGSRTHKKSIGLIQMLSSLFSNTSKYNTHIKEKR